MSLLYNMVSRFSKPLESINRCTLSKDDLFLYIDPELRSRSRPEPAFLAGAGAEKIKFRLCVEHVNSVILYRGRK